MNTASNETAPTSNRGNIPMPKIRYIPLRFTPQQPKPDAGLDVLESDPRIWNVTWFQEPKDEKSTLRLLSLAETAVLPHSGEFIRFHLPEHLSNLIDAVPTWMRNAYSQLQHANDGGQRWQIQLMLPAADGLIHDDCDNRTPLSRITCPTCIYRIAEDRRRTRQQEGKAGPLGMAQLSQRVADAYARLAEAEIEITKRPINRAPSERYREPGPDLRRRFNELADQWQEETAFMSSTHQAHQHPAYQEILDLGSPVVRPMLERMQEQRGHWFSALQQITGESLVRDDERGHIRQMELRWLDWGWQNGLLPVSESNEA